MSEENTLDYKNKKVIIKAGDKPTITIDGTRYVIIYDKEAKTYSADVLPYHTADSLETLAKRLVDEVF